MYVKLIFVQLMFVNIRNGNIRTESIINFILHRIKTKYFINKVAGR